MCSGSANVLVGGTAEEKFVLAFSALDRDGSGTVDREELYQCVDICGHF